MQRISERESIGVNGGYHLHCAWCCALGVANVDFDSEWTAYLHTRSRTHRKYWNNGRGSSQGKCRHKR